jgi:hypothetical protein
MSLSDKQPEDAISAKLKEMESSGIVKGENGNSDKVEQGLRINIKETLETIETQPSIDLRDVIPGDIICLDVTEDGEKEERLVFLEVQNEIEPDILRPGNGGVRNQLLVKIMDGSANPFLVDNPSLPTSFYIEGSSMGGSTIIPSTITRGYFVSVKAEDNVQRFCKAPKEIVILRKNSGGEYGRISAEQLKNDEIFEGSENFQYLSEVFDYLDTNYLEPAWSERAANNEQSQFVSFEWRNESTETGVEIRFNVFGFSKESLTRTISYIDKKRKIFYIINNFPNPDGRIIQVQEFYGVTDVKSTIPHNNAKYEIARNYSNNRKNDGTVAFHAWSKNHPLNGCTIHKSRAGISFEETHPYVPMRDRIETEEVDNEIIVTKKDKLLIEIPVDDGGFITREFKKSMEELGRNLQKTL